ncbi:MAG: CoA transferase, partial [Dehalococcoidia bacterium]|nr:CoA transferase [Dehalococcoidia bacterium]
MKPLAGIKVLDFGWVLAGALPGHMLGDLGADVIKVESRSRLDYMRQGRPIIGTEPDPEQNPMFHSVNRNKRSLAINLKHPEAPKLLERLMAQVDIVIENFSPGVLKRHGLGYDDVASATPRLIYLSLSAVGQDGPLSDLRAYATIIQALSGLDDLTRYQDEPPIGLESSF